MDRKRTLDEKIDIVLDRFKDNKPHNFNTICKDALDLSMETSLSEQEILLGEMRDNKGLLNKYDGEWILQISPVGVRIIEEGGWLNHLVKEIHSKVITARKEYKREKTERTRFWTTNALIALGIFVTWYVTSPTNEQVALELLNVNQSKKIDSLLRELTARDHLLESKDRQVQELQKAISDGRPAKTDK
jgi:uncharacterized membrane protein YheB (UPF0754 family)